MPRPPLPLVRWLLALSVPVAIACGGGPSAPPEEGTVAAVATVVVGPEDIATVVRAPIAAGPRISGTLEAATKAVLRAEAAGSVEQVEVELGQAVTRGQLLGRIDASATRAALASATAGVDAATQDLAVAERELARATRLVEAGALAVRDRELAESQVAAARARHQEAEARRASAAKQVEATTVRSPIAGVVSERAVNAGDVVAPGAPLFTIIEPSSLRLEGAVPADALSQLTVGTTVRFEVQGLPGRTFEGTVARIAPSVDATTRQIPILVDLPNPEGTLVAGLFAEGRVATGLHEGLVVPTDAVQGNPVQGNAVPGNAGASSVVCVRGGKAERVPVEVGLRDDDAERVEIIGAVEPGEILLVGAAGDVVPGTPVEVRAAAAAGQGD